MHPVDPLDTLTDRQMDVRVANLCSSRTASPVHQHQGLGPPPRGVREQSASSTPIFLPSPAFLFVETGV